MSRYVALAHAPRGYFDIGDPPVTTVSSIEVWEADKTPINTGLVDAIGTPVYRLPDTVKMGFVK